MTGKQPKRFLLPAGTRDYMRYSGIGLTMAGCVAVFTLLGRWLDGLVSWKVPVLTLVGALLGVAGAMLYLFRATRKP
ncbi:MAG: AtpZ/AtpI family protein [Flavobacteriales bacterium]